MNQENLELLKDNTVYIKNITTAKWNMNLGNYRKYAMKSGYLDKNPNVRHESHYIRHCHCWETVLSDGLYGRRGNVQNYAAVYDIKGNDIDVNNRRLVVYKWNIVKIIAVYMLLSFSWKF